MGKEKKPTGKIITCKFCNFHGEFKECGFPDWNLRFECPKCKSLWIHLDSESYHNIFPQWVEGGFKPDWITNLNSSREVQMGAKKPVKKKPVKKR